MASLCGWVGTVLFVDLSSGKTARVSTSEYRPAEIIGGVGLGTRIFWDLGCPDVDAFHPDNPLIISTGPLNGTYGGFGKGIICTISPQSYPQELFTYSAFGGRFPAVLKHAGYDALVVLGKAESPVYLSINDKDIAIKSADSLWGMDTFEAQQSLLKHEAGPAMVVIGPAGENLSRIAVIISETNFAAGQGGFGAVMGSKNLKAITVRGTGGIKIARPRDVLQLAKNIKEESITRAEEKVRDWRGPYMSSKDIQDFFAKNYYVKQSGCYGCPTKCVGIHHVPGIGMGGSKCANWGWSPMFSSEPRDIWEANILMQKLGINSFDITCGIPLLLLLAFQAGILSTREIEADIGLPATGWLGGTATDHEFLTVFLNKIARGETPYTQGTPRFLDYFGKILQRGDDVVNMQYELYTARGYAYQHMDNLGSALHWATDSRSPIASSHDYLNPPPEVMEHLGLPQYSSYQIHDLSGTVYEGAEMVTAFVQENQSLKNSLTLCESWSALKNFFDPPGQDLRLFESRIFSAITGVDTDVESLSRAGERIWNLRRAVMVKREKRTREDDTINAPYFEKAIKCYGGSARGRQNGPIDRAKFEALKDRYYRLRGWDVDTGRPTREKLEELGLKDVADGLYS